MEDSNIDRGWSGDWHAAINDLESADRSTAGTTQEPTTSRRKRAPVACRRYYIPEIANVEVCLIDHVSRCRRLRSKCIHENATPPCALCKSAGDVEAKAWCVIAPQIIYKLLRTVPLLMHELQRIC